MKKKHTCPVWGSLSAFASMKTLLAIIVAVLLAVVTPSTGNAISNDRVSGTLEISNAAKLKVNRLGTIEVNDNASTGSLVRKFVIGAPALAAADTVVASANMKVGTYTIADSTPDVVPRNITVTRTVAGSTDTPGTVTIVGTDYLDAAISETITVGADGVTVAGTKAFKTVTSVTGAGWVLNATSTSTADTITVGRGTLVGLPFKLADATGTTLATLGTTVGVYNTTGGTAISSATVDASGATYNGSKILTLYMAK